MSTPGSPPTFEEADLDALARRMLEMAGTGPGAAGPGPASRALPSDATATDVNGAAALAAVLAEGWPQPPSVPPGVPYYTWMAVPEGGQPAASPPSAGEAPAGAAPTAVPPAPLPAASPMMSRSLSPSPDSAPAVGILDFSVLGLPTGPGPATTAPRAPAEAPSASPFAATPPPGGASVPAVAAAPTSERPSDLPYFLRSVPVPGSSAPDHPTASEAPAPAWARVIPGADLRVPGGAASREGQDTSLVSLEGLAMRPGGGDVPPSGRTPTVAPSVTDINTDFVPAAWAAVPVRAPIAPSAPAATAAGTGPTGYATDTLGRPRDHAVAQPDTPSQRRPGLAIPSPRVRDDFPILHQEVNGHRLVWLDSAATTQKPNAVIDAISHYYRRDNSNVHRGAHTLAGRATAAFEGARETVRRFLGAGSAEEIVFVRGTTEGVNLVAHVFGQRSVRRGDEVVVSQLEHHSNIVPWQLLCERTGAVLRVIPVDDRGELLLDAYERLLGPRTRLVAVTHVSNALGTLVPVEAVVALAHRHGVPVLVDGAQAVAHIPVNVRALDVDFYVFSGHKIYGPTGIGAVYAKRALLEALPPWQGGGNMIDSVSFEGTTYAPVPAKFEAGTAHIAGAVGLAAALDYVDRVGRPAIAAHEQALMATMVESLRSVTGLRFVGAPRVRVGAVSFLIDGHDPREIAQHLDRHGIALRAGHHCAQPILRRFGLQATVRPSLGMYNETDDVEELVAALRRLPPRRPE